ncbi:hypothetical protein [Streptomyces bauhiniae]|uniref:Uncharacterized protein n=1 Tax=Streptomyces bauhiniae TaxID=2340725 RepID=A0A7K3QVI4_9ACTN|nr:hypothetical protein [Streptomyces bauhiniae]NEB93908.1 hypothetical protein [Streptomyces bauhiniae]
MNQRRQQASGIADLGLANRPSTERAELLSTRSVYDQSGTRELEKFGPLGRIDLVQDLTSGGTTLVAAHTSVLARGWTSKRYEEGRPQDAVGTSNQITSTKEAAQVREHPAVMADAQTTMVAKGHLLVLVGHRHRHRRLPRTSPVGGPAVHQGPARPRPRPLPGRPARPTRAR